MKNTNAFEIVSIITVIFLSSVASLSRNIHKKGFVSNAGNRREVLKKGLSFVGSSAALSSMEGCIENANAVDLSSFQDGPRGLKFLVTKEGSGPTPIRAQKVSAIYTLTINGFPEDGGKKIDSNAGFLGQPFKVPVGVGMVVKGWDLTLIDMKVGEARRLVIPPDLGYGERGAGGRIPPNTTLYFDIEMVGMEDKPNYKPEQLEWLEKNPI